MFSIANRIAYENRMVFGLDHPSMDKDPHLFAGPSCWIDVPGLVAGRQSVPEQNAFVARVVAGYFETFDALPEIYIISPFKEVKEALIRQLNDQALWARLEKAPPSLRSWTSERIGTVHTFQGKQEEAVFLALGADERTVSAARWAAAKPNILNVALTRAKQRIYVVGDRSLWGQLRYFQEAHKELPPVSATEFEQHASRQRNDA